MASENQAIETETQEESADSPDKDDVVSPEELLARQEKEILDLRSEIEDLKDQYLRKQADMDNYRKRLLREREDAVSYANKQLLLDTIGIIDDFERAIQSSESAENFDSLHDGVVMIEKQFSDMLQRKWNLTRFEAEGEDFDPEKHEAVMVEERPGTDTQIVLQVFQQGYMFKDIVLRTAKVKVSQPLASEEVAASEETSVPEEEKE